ncbi:hypothetical protein ACP4OV_014079 [Aristida adscensionis]
MGLLGTNLLMSLQREQRRRRRRGQMRAPNGSVALLPNRKRRSKCHHDDGTQGGKRMRYSGPDLPEETYGTTYIP